MNPGVAVYADGASLSRALLNEDADALLRGADRARLPWYRASAQEEAGRMLLNVDPVRAIQVLERALAGYEQAGSERDAARVRSRLRRPALATGAHHDRRRAATGWESLTAAQRRVALVVGSGMTNAKAADRLSVSRHTVDSHLRQVFGKLNINSRAELVRLTVQRGEIADAIRPEPSTRREPSPHARSALPHRCA